jgi:hypothetical protein
VTRLQGRLIVLERYFWGAATESLERYFEVRCHAHSLVGRVE